MTASVHQFSGMGCGGYSMTQVQLDNIDSVPEKENAFSWTYKQKYSMEKSKSNPLSLRLLYLSIVF